MKTLKTLLAFIAIMTLSSFMSSGSGSGYKIGDTATDFSLKNIDGTMVSLSNYKDAKGFIVIFTCNTCPYAVAYEERVEAWKKKYASLGYPVIAIMPNNTDVKPGDNMEARKARANA